MTLRDTTKLIVVDSKEISIDIRSMLADIYDTESTKDGAYFNATPIAKQFGKEAYKFMELKSTKEYINILDEIDKNDKLDLPSIKRMTILTPKLWGDEKKGFRLYEDGKEVPVQNVTCRSYTVINPKGGFAKGTYMQTDLFFEFLRWLNPTFKVLIDRAFMNLLRDINWMKNERVATIEEFHDLIEASNKYYVPYQNGYAQEYANHKLMDMVNCEVLGCKASTFKQRNGISASAKTREWATPEQLQGIKKAEKIVCGLITYKEIRDYKTLKQELHDRMVNQ